MTRSDFTTETVELDLPPLVATFTRRLRAAGVPVGPEHAVRLARALTLTRPVARRRLYWTARAVLVSDPAHARPFDRVFSEVFGPRTDSHAESPELAEDLLPASAHDGDVPPAPRTRGSPASSPAGAPSARPPGARRGEEADAPPRLVPVLASDEELLRDKRFDALEPGELADLYRLMARLRVAPPMRRTRRARHDRHGERIDLRRTLRRAHRTGGDPIQLARRRRASVRRRMVMLCDISGSMEPYARVYLQFLVCAAGGGLGRGGHEAFAFATRLTRLTRALSSRNPERAIERAAAAAPDWSSGTRIGDALKTFNDRHGRRGMARGAVVVILSDGWERGDPALLGRELERLRRLAYRIVWVNPRAAATGFAPRAGGMLAALPHCDALVSGHSLRALGEVADAIAAPRSADRVHGTSWTPPAPPPAGEDPEPWASATPVAGSSVAMPSGYSPSRGRTTPGWSAG